MLAAWGILGDGKKALLHLAPGTKDDTASLKEYFQDMRLDRPTAAMRPARKRKSAFSGQADGSRIRMRAAPSMPQAEIFISRRRRVTNSAMAQGEAEGAAACSVCSSQQATTTMCRTSRNWLARSYAAKGWTRARRRARLEAAPLGLEIRQVVTSLEDTPKRV